MGTRRPMRRLAMLFWPAGILYAMQAIVTLLLVIFGRGDDCGPHSAALVWWTAGVGSLLLQVRVILSMKL